MIKKILKTVLYLFVFFVLLLIILFFIPEDRKQLRTKHFNLVFSSSIDTAKIKELSHALESSYHRIAEDLKTNPSNDIETNIYADRWRYIKSTGNWSGSGNIEGISKLHFVEQAWSETDSKKVAVHEFVHTVTLKLLLDQEPKSTDSKEFDNKFAKFPVWLWEAISVYEAQQFIEPKTLTYLANGQYPSIAELNQRIKGGKIYTCGYTIIEYILFEYGQDKFLALIKNYGDLENTLGINEMQFSKNWYEFVKTKYLK